MKLWGVIGEINKKDLVVALPGGLRGFVRVVDAFDQLNGEIKVKVAALVLFPSSRRPIYLKCQLATSLRAS